MRAAVAGTHPFTRWEDVEVSPGARYQFLYSSMRELARREPTFGLHVHVAVPEPGDGGASYNRMRAHLPMLLALAGNSPFWQGRDTGLCSMRTPLFQAFPRVGIPRLFRSYADYVEGIDVLLRCDAFPEPTFLWWDVRLQPRFGTLEVRVMDAQTRVADTAAIAALVQCLVRLEALEGHAGHGARDAARGARGEPLHRGARRDGGGADRPRASSAGGRRASGSRSCSSRARRTPPTSAASRSSTRCASSPRPPARCASGRARAAGRSRSSGA